ncbi:MAG: hypothetical protein ACPGKS_09770, partial [Coraliomargarita sp.]
MRSLFRKFKEGLKKQTPTFSKAFDHVFTGATLDEDALDELEEALYVISPIATSTKETVSVREYVDT